MLYVYHKVENAIAITLHHENLFNNIYYEWFDLLRAMYTYVTNYTKYINLYVQILKVKICYYIELQVVSENCCPFIDEN